MSWFDLVVNKVRAVSKTIDDVVISTIDPTQAAVPFKDEIRRKPNDATQPDNVNNETESGNTQEDIGEGSNQPASASGFRVTTRARITYELDRFKWNAMLMFVQIKDERGPKTGLSLGRVHDLTIKDASELVETFMNFRFEVTAHTDLTCSEINAKFFQRDFTKYGAVVVVVLSALGFEKKLQARDGSFSESVIVRHLTTDVNPTLLGKPKIYITEAARSITMSGVQPLAPQPSFSLPIEEHHQDILCLHIPVVIQQIVTPSWMNLLCYKINKMADSHDFVSILKKFVEDAGKICLVPGIFPLPIQLTNHFTKEMLLARS